jgi:hypothetical protein
MRVFRLKKKLFAALGTALLILLAGAATVQAAIDPLVIFTPVPPTGKEEKSMPPTGRLNGPCGIAVDSTGRFYVSDYYHHTVNIFKSKIIAGRPWESYESQIAEVDPFDGPCGLGLNSSDQIYVNNFHRNVVRYGAAPGFGLLTTFPLPVEDKVHHLPTGVAVDPTSDRVYVDHRTYVSVFDAIGNPVIEAGEPLKIGVGSLGDGYGVAVSQFPGTDGYVYVPDASTNTVKVYNPSVSTTTPTATIKNPINQPFVSLKDAAVAVDRVTGQVYFTDNTQPVLTERPQASIYVYSSSNAYNGRLKYNVTDALPVGLAVDNSGAATQGRVYVTSGYTENASVYVYAPGSATFNAPLPPTQSVLISASGTGKGAVTSNLGGIDCSGTCSVQMLSGQEVTLTATPESGSGFASWSGGGCSGSAPTCTVTMDGAVSVRADFSAAAAPSAEDAVATAAATSAAPIAAQQRHRGRGRRRRHPHKPRHRGSRPYKAHHHAAHQPR